MADPDAQPSESEPGAPIARPRRAHTILGRLSQAVREQNWFAVALEVVIVILGVVIGFQITAWGQARSDAARERTYLLQLAADLRETERVMDDADAYLRLRDQAGTRLVHAFYQPEPPSEDSLVAWLRTALRLRPASPVLGTAEALVATGDLGLIRDDSLRSAITAYLDETRQWVDLNAGMISRWFAADKGLRRIVDLDALGDPSRGGLAKDSSMAAEPYWPLPGGETAVPFPFDAAAFLSDREALAYVQDLNDEKRDIWFVRARLREAATDLRIRVEAALDE